MGLLSVPPEIEKAPPRPLLSAKVAGVPFEVRNTGGVTPNGADPSALRSCAPPAAEMKARRFASTVRSTNSAVGVKNRSAIVTGGGAMVLPMM